MKYSLVAVGGTFDTLHAGHKRLLTTAFHSGKSVLIGLTSDKYVAVHKSGTVHTYKERCTALTAWLSREGFSDRYEIVPLDDPFGPTVSLPSLEALIVSQETKATALTINSQRSVQGIPPLDIIVVPLLNADDTLPISSTRIRKGEITDEGKLTLPDSLRDELAQPLGIVLTGVHIQESIHHHTGTSVVTVGDLTTKTVLDAGVMPKLMIIDHKVNRQAYTDLDPLLMNPDFNKRRVTSGPGFISQKAITLITEVLESSTMGNIIEVTGEDDLLTLPAIIAAPLNTILYYGQPPVPLWACGPVTEGVVEVIVTSAIQQTAANLLKKFVTK